MVTVLKLFGAALLLCFALLLLRAYKRFLCRRREECDGFLAMIEAVRDGVDYFLSPIGRIFERFCEGDSLPAKFATRIKEGASPKEAFDGIKDKLAVGKDGKDILEKFFSAVGRGYKAGSVALSEACRKRFSEYSERVAEEDEKNARLTTALVLGGALGVIILLI